MGDDDHEPGSALVHRPLARAQWRLDPAPEAPAAPQGGLATVLSSLEAMASLQGLEDFNGALVLGGHEAAEARVGRLGGPRS